jgi:TP901 family phage tail tape measure protein
MAKMTASLVVDLVDKTGAKSKAIIGNLTALQKAERELEMARNGTGLSRRQKALEAVMIQKQAEIDARRAHVNALVTSAALGTAAAGYVAVQAYRDFADVERRMNRIAVNADKGAETIAPNMAKLQAIAKMTKMSYGDIASGLDTLIASGRTLEESLSFLPSVALTAQASGAAISDIALSADSLAGSLKISAPEMQKAFDILVAGGKAGKFELKDMAQYLPSLAPAFAALGYEGTDGLKKLVAMLQVARNQTGDASTAATNLANVFQKMYSAETARKFKEFGVDLPKALEDARKSGKDVINVLLEMTNIATKGDLSKLTLLFTDAQMQAGIRALITQRDAMNDLNTELGNVDGSALKAFNQIAGDSAAKIQDLSNNWNAFMTSLGAGVATVANPVLSTLNQQLDDFQARLAYEQSQNPDLLKNEKKVFDERFRKQNPDVWNPFASNKAYMDAQARVGRGEAKSVFDDMNEKDRKAAAWDQYINRGSKASRGRHSRTAYVAGNGMVPVPTTRPEATNPYDWHGYRPGKSEEPQSYEYRVNRHRANRQALANADPASLGMNPDTGPKSVSITGTPTVKIDNPPQPNVYHISVSTVVNEAKNGVQIAREIGANIKTALEGVHADLGHR